MPAVQPLSASHKSIGSAAAKRRVIFRKFRLLAQEIPELHSRFERARQIRAILRKSNNYDLTSRCNLFCEGCFYFEGDDYKQASENMDVTSWGRFFAQQAESGVTFAFFAGAEPALAQDRLREAAKHIPRGSVHSNGTIRIAPDIPYSIQISVWGDDETTAHFRGGNVFWKSLRNFANDPRVRYVFTVNPGNIAQIPHVVRIMSDHGQRIMFNYFSPTETYLQKLASEADNDGKFFRISSQSQNMVFTQESLRRARLMVREVIESYPMTVIQSAAFDTAVTTPGQIYELDEKTGIASNCNGRNFAWHQSYRVDMQPSDAKCCQPNVDCSQCRLYTNALASFIFQPERFRPDPQGLADWLDICDQFAHVCLLDSDSVWGESSDVA